MRLRQSVARPIGRCEPCGGIDHNHEATILAAQRGNGNDRGTVCCVTPCRMLISSQVDRRIRHRGGVRSTLVALVSRPQPQVGKPPP